MASNDGQRLSVLGLTFSQHHTLRMQQVLRTYGRLPASPSRAALYAALFELAKELDEDETRNLEEWLKNGGEFPAPTPKNPPPTAGTDADDVEEDDVGEWPDYRPEDFESASSGIEEDEDNRNAEEMEDDDESGGGDRDMNEGDLSSDLDEDEEEEVDHRRYRPVRKAAGISIECLICAESYDTTEFPAKTQITSSCNHKNDERVCVYCLQQSIATAVTEGQLHLIICPFCPEKLSHGEVKQYATREVFARYVHPNPTALGLTNKLFRYEYLKMMATPDLVMCLGVNCGSGQIHVGEDPMMVCESCSFKTCAVHKLPWHEGQTCEEFDMDDSQIERLEEAEATAKLLAKEHAQVCPNCNNGVSRTVGCDHMTCKFSALTSISIGHELNLCVRPVWSRVVLSLWHILREDQTTR